MITCDVDDSGAAIDLRLSGDATMANAVALGERLLACVVPGRDVVVDIDGLERLDGAGVQLLFALKTMVERSDATMTVRSGNDVVRAALENAGADALLLGP